MDPKQVILIEELAAVALTNAIQLYGSLRANNPGLASVEEILAKASATADQVIAKADSEIAATGA